MGKLKDWYDTTGPAQRKSHDWKKIARADLKGSIDSLGLVLKRDKFYDRDTDSMVIGETPSKKKKKKPVGKAPGMAKGGKVSCRGMGAATRGGRFRKDG